MCIRDSDSIGINVNNSFGETALADTATSLAAELGREISRRELAAAVLNELDDVYTRSLTPAGFEAIRRDFEKMDMLQGQDGEVITPEGGVSGIATCLLYTSPSPRDRTRSRMP